MVKLILSGPSLSCCVVRLRIDGRQEEEEDSTCIEVNLISTRKKGAIG